MSHYQRVPMGLHRRKKMPILRIKIIMGIGIVMLIILYGYIAKTGDILLPEKTIVIEKGSTLSELNKIGKFDISNWRYVLWLRIFAIKPKLQAGQYVVSSGTTLSDFFLKNLKHPNYTDQTITILPGWNIYDIDQYLANEGICGVGDVLETMTLNFAQYQKDFPFLVGVSSLEGFLYPDTYRVKQHASVDAILRTLLEEWQRQIGPTYTTLGDDAYNTLILASIVEREERNLENQPIVAGILKKRYQEGMPIGADATVCYGYAKTHKDCTPSYIADVINKKNPYNTRNMQGYPPTPISSITKNTWGAAMNPEKSVYYYYLHDNTGMIHYARDLAGHAKNKHDFLE